MISIPSEDAPALFVIRQLMAEAAVASLMPGQELLCTLQFCAGPAATFIAAVAAEVQPVTSQLSNAQVVPPLIPTVVAFETLQNARRLCNPVALIPVDVPKEAQSIFKNSMNHPCPLTRIPVNPVFVPNVIVGATPSPRYDV